MIVSPFNICVMNKNFDLVVSLIKTLNALNKGFSKDPRFSYQFKDGEMRIYGLACDLAHLYTLLWAECSGFSFLLSKDREVLFLECY